MSKDKLLQLRNFFFQLLYIIRIRTLKFIMYDLKLKSGTEIAMLFVKTETNTSLSFSSLKVHKLMFSNKTEAN